MCGVMVTLICVASCAKQEYYSCDPVVDVWTKSNLSTVQTMTREDWLAIDNLPYQRGAYSAFLPNQRFNLWETKMNELLLLDWSYEETLHIQKLLLLLNTNPQWFDVNRAGKKEYDKLKEVLSGWREYALQTLGWDNRLISSILYCPYPVIDKEGTLQLPSLCSFQKMEQEAMIPEKERLPEMSKEEGVIIHVIAFLMKITFFNVNIVIHHIHVTEHHLVVA